MVTLIPMDGAPAGKAGPSRVAIRPAREDEAETLRRTQYAQVAHKAAPRTDTGKPLSSIRPHSGKELKVCIIQAQPYRF